MPSTWFPARILVCRLKMAKAYDATEDWASACDVLRRAETEAGLADDPRRFAMVQANLVTCLVQAGNPAEAQKRLPHAKALYDLYGGGTDRLRLRWIGALLLQRLGLTEEAAQELEAVQTEFLDRRMPVDATLVSLDLAVALFESGQSEALKPWPPRSSPSSRPAA